MTPTWPQLAGWLATAHVDVAHGTARGPDVGGEVAFAIDGPRLELRWPDGRRFADDGTRAVLVETDGTATLHRDGEARTMHRLLRGLPLDRDDFHRAAGPPRPVTTAGRPAWAVDLLPPPHKHGRWRIVVDDETGCLLSTAHELEGPQVEIGALSLAADPDARYDHVGAEPVDPTSAGRHEVALLEAGRGPTVHHHPRGYWSKVVHADGERVLVELDAEHPGVTLSAAPVGQEPLDPGSFATRYSTRVIGDHLWLIASYEPVSDADADAMFASARWVPRP